MTADTYHAGPIAGCPACQSLTQLRQHVAEHGCQPPRQIPQPCATRARLQRHFNQLTDYGTTHA